MDTKFLRGTRKKMRKTPKKKNGMSPAAVTQNLLMDSEEKEIIEGI